MIKQTTASLMALAMGGAVLAAPVQAAEFPGISTPSLASVADMTWHHADRDDWDDDDWDDDDDDDDDRYYGRRHRGDRYYGEPVYRETRVWRGRDGRYYCRKRDGTTGLIIGGAVGALLGREIDTRGDRTLGTLLGGVGGALLGREVARNRGRCR